MGRRAAQQLLAWLTAQEEHTIALLEELVVAESPSVDPRALERALAIVERELVELGFVVRRAAGAQGGSHLFARPRLRYRHSGRQLVIGHVDTVWPLGTLETMPLRRGGGDLFGPGVFDMKGGLVELVYALRALAAAGLVPSVTPVVFVNVDEEVGSLDSRRHLLRLAQGAVRAFVLEGAAGREGALKTARKGGGHFTLSVHGRAAHAGSSPEEGVSAIVELAEQIRRLNELNDPARGVTVNVGTVDGGVRPNVVAPLASAEIDVRAPTARDADRLERAVRALESTLPGASLEIGGGFRRPPMEASPANRALCRRAQELARLLGYTVGEAGVVGGSSDANLTSVWAPTLDGLGPVGEGAHAQDERIVVSSLSQRAALLALLLLEPAPSGTLPARRRSRMRSRARVLLVGTPSNETNGRLRSAWSRLGIEVELVSARAARDLLRPGDVTLGRLDVLPTLDGVEPGLLELLVLESSGFTVLNGARTLVRCHDKWRTAQVLRAAGLPHPATGVVAGTRRPISLEPPVVVKPRFGSWGAAVERCDTRDEVEDCLARASATSWFRRHGALVQELVPSAGVDLRVVVAGGEVVGAIERVAPPGEWRTNTSLGAVRRPVDPPADARALAIAAAVAVGASLVGVDLLPLAAGGYTVVELNGAVDFNVEYGVGRDALMACAEALGLRGPGSKFSERAAHAEAG